MMRINRLIFAGLVVAGTAAISVNGEEPEYGSSPVNSASEALELAMRYTGFAGFEGIDRNKIDELVKTATAEDTTTPFFADSIDGRTVWQVELRGIVLDLKYKRRGVNPNEYTKDALVTIDSLTGRIVEIRLQNSGNDVGDKYDMPSKQAEKDIRIVGGEVYLGFPMIPPGLPFIEALNADGLMGSPLISDLIVVNYFMHHIYGSDTLPVWVVHMHGNTPFLEPGQTHWRNVIDAASGKLIHVINRPGSR